MRHEPGSPWAACLPRAVDGDATSPRHAASMRDAPRRAAGSGLAAASALLATTAVAWHRQGDRVVTGAAPLPARRLAQETATRR